MNRCRVQQLLLMLCFLCNTITVTIEDRIEPPAHPRKGNFAHAISPGNSFAFGQNIVSKHAFDFYPTFNASRGEKSSYADIFLSSVYGISDRCSLYAGLPIIVHQKNDDQKVQRGVGSLFAQLEYAFYLNNSELTQDMLTIVGSVGLPTEHLSHDYCVTSTQTSNFTAFFGGMTASRISVYWYLYASAGATVFVPKNHVWQRCEILYEWGLGRVITTTKRTTIMGLIEFNGIYNAQTKIYGFNYAHSGSNIFYVGPSLCVTGDRCYVSIGIQGPLFQSLKGCQNKQKYRLAGVLSIQF